MFLWHFSGSTEQRFRLLTLEHLIMKTSYCYFLVFKNILIEMCPNKRMRCYSGGNSCCNKALFMKQKCQIQMGVGQYKNAATPLRTRGINTTHQHFQMRYITLIYLKGLKSYQPPNFKCVISVLKQTLHYFDQ